MKTIVAIGGGELGRDGEPADTLAIDQRIVALTGKEFPKVLFIPTASNDAEGYIDLFNENYGENLSCLVSVLRLCETTDSRESIASRIGEADAIYVGGGNPVSMLKIWNELGVHQMLKEAYESGTVLSGLSAGAVCWFENALSDTLKFEDPQAPLSLITALNFKPLTVCPHYNAELDRRPGFREALRNTDLIGVGIDNCAALLLEEDEISVLSSDKNGAVWICFWAENRYWETPMGQNEKIGISELAGIRKAVSEIRSTP